MTVEELRLIYEAMTIDMSGMFDKEEVGNTLGYSKDCKKILETPWEEWDSILSNICYVGQPVKVSET